MMSLEQKAKAGVPAKEEAAPQKERPNSGEVADPIEKLDLEISVKLGERMLKDAGGMKVLQQGIQESGDPTQVVSKFLVQLIMQIKEGLDGQGIDLSPSVVLGRGGWVEQMLDVVEGELGLPPGFSDDAFNDVMETFKAMNQGGNQPAQGAAPAAGGPVPAGQAPAGQPIVAPSGGGVQGRMA